MFVYFPVSDKLLQVSHDYSTSSEIGESALRIGPEKRVVAGIRILGSVVTNICYTNDMITVNPSPQLKSCFSNGLFSA